MKVAVFGKSFTLESRSYVETLHSQLMAAEVELRIFTRLNHFIREHCNLNLDFKDFDTYEELLKFSPDFLITLGGDGTILDAVTYVRSSGIPILGINTGRLGFLSNVSKENISEAVKALIVGKYVIDERYVIVLNTNSVDMGLNFALNEVAISRKDTTAMITVHAWINDDYLSSYWADGVIVATPTGSTGYSLSCGGPIIMPSSESLVITPIAPHNLNLRPFVIPNKYNIKLKVEGRKGQFLVSMDSRIHPVDFGSELEIGLGEFKVKMVKTEVQDFITTLRNKLLWGLDRRN